MATRKYVSLEKLSLYDEKIKALINTKDGETLASAKSYADGLASNYDAAGAAATALSEAKTYADGKDAAIAEAKKAGDDAQADVDALESKVGTVADGKTVVGLIDDAQAAADAAQDDVDALETYVGTIPDTATATNVIAYIQEKTAGIATDTALEELTGRVAQAETDIDAIEADYLKASDKTELQGNIDAVDDRVDVLVGTDTGKSVRAIANEELVAQLIPETAQESLDTLQEIAAWIQSHPDDASAMSDAIDTLEALVGDIPEDATATDIVTYIQEVVAAEKTRAEGIESGLDTRLDAIEAKFGEGEGSVADMIADEASRVDGLLANKVDKVEGKGLSTNDLTNELKTNYDAAYAHSLAAHAPADAQANVIESVKVNGAALTVTDKAVDITVPTDNTELTNGAGYLVASDIAGKADKATTLAGYGITDAYTSEQTDTAIADAIAQFVEVSEEEINALFTA